MGLDADPGSGTMMGRRGKRDAADGEKILTALSTLGDRPRPNMTAYKPERRPVRDLAVKLMRKRGWGYRTPRDGLRRRLYSLAVERHPWWDWGHRLMILTGTDWGGNWSEPEPPTWWYRRGPAHRMWRTGYPRHRVCDFQVVVDYDEFCHLTDGLDEDRMYEWQAINASQDGELQLGHQYWGKTFYGMPTDEIALLRRYLRMWRRYDWWGLRSWLYSQALHAAVHRRKPRACNVTPPRGSGGYDHWHCENRRRHGGDHRYGSYVWPGGDAKVEYQPTERS